MVASDKTILHTVLVGSNRILHLLTILASLLGVYHIHGEGGGTFWT